MAVFVCRNFFLVRINQINRIVRFRPGMDDIVSLINVPDRFALFQPGRRIVDHHVAVFREADANDQMPVIVEWPARLESIPTR